MRASAALAAIAATVFMALPLMLGPVVNRWGTVVPQVSYLIMVTEPSAASSVDGPARLKALARSQPRTAPARTVALEQPPVASGEGTHAIASERERPPAKTHMGEGEQSHGERGFRGTQVPLDLSSTTVNRAVANSTSGFRSAAQASGAFAGDTALSPSERLARDTQRSGKEDCLRRGGSLLSPLVALYELATDKCSSK